MKKFEGKYPANARVDIDYSNGKPKVKFSYPKNGQSGKTQAFKQHSLGYHTILIFIISYFLFAIMVGGFLEKDKSSPKECNNFSLDKSQGNLSIIININGNLTKTNSSWEYIKGFNITCDNLTYEYIWQGNKNYWTNLKPLFVIKNGYKESKIAIYMTIGLLVILILVGYTLNKIITYLLLKSKRYVKWFPESQARGVFFKTKKKKYICFKPQDVINNEVIIPSFSNVELDYKTDGDFDKNLVKIMIREHRHNDYLVKQKKVGKESVNCYRWYARFIFNKKPNKGKMEVIYQ